MHGSRIPPFDMFEIGRTQLRAASSRNRLEVKAELGRVSPWRQKVSAAKGRQEIVKRNFVGDIDRGYTKAPLVLVAMKDIVLSDGNVEQVARRNTRRIVIV